MRFNLFILLFESKIPSENVFLFTLWSFTFKILFDKILCVAYDLSLWIKFVQSPCRCEKQLKPIFILNHQVMTPLLLDVGCRWVCVEAHKNQFLQESKKRAYAILLFNVLCACACAYECLCVCVVCLAFGIQFIHDNEITEKCIHPIHLTRWFFTVVDILQCTWHTHTHARRRWYERVRVKKAKNDGIERVKEKKRQIKSTMQILFHPSWFCIEKKKFWKRSAESNLWPGKLNLFICIWNWLDVLECERVKKKTTL